MGRGNYQGGGTVLRNGQLPPETAVVIVRKPKKIFSRDVERGATRDRLPAPPALKSAERIEAEREAALTKLERKERRREMLARATPRMRQALVNAIALPLHLTEAEITRLDRMDLVLEGFLQRPESECALIGPRIGRILSDYLAEAARDLRADVPIQVALLRKSHFLSARIGEVITCLSQRRPFRAGKSTARAGQDDEPRRRAVLCLLEQATKVDQAKLRHLEVFEAAFRRARTMQPAVQAWILSSGRAALEQAILNAVTDPSPDDPDGVHLPEQLSFLLVRPMPAEHLRQQVRDLRGQRLGGLFDPGLIPAPVVPEPPPMTRRETITALQDQLARIEARQAAARRAGTREDQEMLRLEIEELRFSLRGKFRPGTGIDLNAGRGHPARDPDPSP
ncbi:hypothetical protein LAZ40_06920 [Cereibacter sphaeroides]|uniref:hypothetical protein n=1 Tax=Cereibacter sphaeroides TaxID=1063 RepID=UPI001F2A8184|nr:hypothetical protein [Cereibacter sphaeroides]MCE6958779.1 hypothetical protein [Cereibacter sphaeroides]MCE6973347.1 hypothetical protein [Cereibacter sphaeroides]